MASHANCNNSLQEHQRKQMTIDCRSSFELALGSLFTWADVAAICYVALKDAMANESEEVFIAGFFEMADGTTGSNPNYQALETLTERVRQIAAEEMRLEETSSSSRELFLTAISHVKLEEFGTDSHNAAAPYWAIIRGIDRAYGDNPKFDSIKRRGPLNTACRDRVGVYLTAPPSVMSTALSSSGLKRIPEFAFNSQLWYIHFYEKHPDRCLPNVRMTAQSSETNSEQLQAIQPLPPSQQGDLVKSHAAGLSKRTLLEGQVEDWPQHVRVGMFLFSPVTITGIAHFNEDGNYKKGEAMPVTFVAKQGRALSAVYREGYTDDYRGAVIDALETCIRAGCQIVVFPEVVISAGIRKAIVEYLENSSHRHRPQLVVAGSSWEPGKNSGDNISYLFDGYGHEMGRYYKVSPYGSFEDADHIAFVEGLDSPGKECTIIDVKGIGRVLPSICKDLVSDTRYTLDLARDFAPNLVCAPALSPSMDTGFSTPVNILSERSLSITVVCNQCGCMKERRGQDVIVSMVGGPLKSAESSSRTRCLPLHIVRNDQCRRDCLSKNDEMGSASCVRIIDIDCNAFAEEGYISDQRISLQQVN